MNVNKSKLKAMKPFIAFTRFHLHDRMGSSGLFFQLFGLIYLVHTYSRLVHVYEFWFFFRFHGCQGEYSFIYNR